MILVEELCGGQLPASGGGNMCIYRSRRRMPGGAGGASSHRAVLIVLVNPTTNSHLGAYRIALQEASGGCASGAQGIKGCLSARQGMRMGMSMSAWFCICR